MMDAIDTQQLDESPVCPICQEIFLSLLQLNQHLDDAHASSDKYDSSKRSVFTWWDYTARAITPVFEKAKDYAHQLTLEVQEDTNQTDKITHEHWQPETPNDTCFKCAKPLSRMNRRHHCRRCGRIFCDECSSFQIKLNTDANHDPVNGVWARVCQQCFESRKGYHQEFGTTRDLTKSFKKTRKTHLDRAELQVSRLEKRLEKLQKIYESGAMSVASAAFQREKEQSVVKWEEDSAATHCRWCRKPFGLLSLRRHHCRLCGLSMCATETCSSMIPVANDSSEYQVRVCKDCNTILSRKQKQIAEQKTKPPPVLAYYDQLVQARDFALTNLPVFNEYLLSLRKENDMKARQRIFEQAANIREQLILALQKIDDLSKRIAAIPVDDKAPSYASLHKNIRQAAVFFLQTHMFSLSLMPKDWNTAKALQDPSAKSKVASSSSSASNKKGSSSSSAPATPTASSSSSSSSAQTGKQQQPKQQQPTKSNEPELPQDAKRLKQTIEVMKQQRDQVQQFIREFMKEGKNDDVETLIASEKELDQEIYRLEAILKRRFSSKS